METLKELDLLGTLFLVPGVVCLLLALQLGGVTYPWSDGRIISWFVIFGVCLPVFFAIQFWQPDRATLSPKLLRNRSVSSGAWYAFTMGASFYTLLYYLPIWFQAIKGASALRSGIMNIPLVLAVVIGSISSGILVTSIGHYVPFMILGSIAMAIGEGLLTTFTPTTNHSAWIGYQVLCGLGIGWGMQQPLIAVQVVVAKAEIPTATALLVFMQTLGAAIFVSIGQSIFENHLISGIREHVPQVDPRTIIGGGATNLEHFVPERYLGVVVQIYNDALVKSFQLALIVGCLTILGTVGVRWKSVKGLKM